jgi:hypothetical protein
LPCQVLHLVGVVLDLLIFGCQKLLLDFLKSPDLRVSILPSLGAEFVFSFCLLLPVLVRTLLYPGFLLSKPPLGQYEHADDNRHHRELGQYFAQRLD